MFPRFTRLFRLPALYIPFALAAFALLAIVLTAHAATLPTGFSETQLTASLTNPTSFAFAPDGRIFITQQAGTLRVIKDGALLAAPFVTLNVDSTGERGLLGVAFDPDFANNQYVYVYYTPNVTPRHNRVSRFTADGDVAAANSEVQILDLDNLSGATNHNGGAIHFGPDGKLYVAVGENANAANAQTLNNRLGKILRINSDGTIPTDNPFYGTATGDNRAIWAMGLRNPFTFSFQPGSGRMFVNDVGQAAWEEINDGIAGSNYGWNVCEGFCSPPNPSYRDPLLTYSHSTGAYTGCAIVGSTFYNPVTAQFPSDYTGDYFYADLCNGWIRQYDIAGNTSTLFASGIGNPVDLHVSDDGALYYLARNPAGLWRVSFTGAPTNTPTNTATGTLTFTPTNTRTNTPTNTATGTLTFTPTSTGTNSPIPSPTSTATPTLTSTATRTLTATVTPTKTPTRTPTRTVTLTKTPTRTSTGTATATRTRTFTQTATRTRTPTKTPTRTFTPDGPWIYCAHENHLCTFSGTRQVRYGANGKFKIKTFTNSVSCSNSIFGDPIPGVVKVCHYQ